MKPGKPRLKFGLDTSCLVPLLSTWHENHVATYAAYESRIRRGEHAVISAHALLECFSVLTRLPAPMRIPPSEVSARLMQNFRASADLVGIGPEAHWDLIAGLSARSIGGGRVYDALIATSTLAAGASVLLTWNVKDFLAVAPQGLEVRQP
jgi:predicted nucleic acid-binding protein